MQTTTVKERIVKARLALGLSQRQMAARLGVTKSAVSLWETKVREVPTSAIRLITHILGVSENWLLTGEGEMLLDRKGYLLSSLETQWNVPANEAKMIVNLITALPDQRKEILESIVWPKKRRW